MKRETRISILSGMAGGLTVGANWAGVEGRWAALVAYAVASGICLWCLGDYLDLSIPAWLTTDRSGPAEPEPFNPASMGPDSLEENVTNAEL